LLSNPHALIYQAKNIRMLTLFNEVPSTTRNAVRNAFAGQCRDRKDYSYYQEV
jgi:hypothetical protein